MEAREFHRIETWRDRLLAEGPSALEALLSKHPDLDAPRLRRLIASGRQDPDTPTATQASRELFRYLRSALAGSDASA
jgi:ribosome-associated protein